MKILGLGVPELVIILVVVLLIFGPKNLPKLGSSIGKAVKGLREGMGNNKESDESAEATGEVVVEDAPAASTKLTDAEETAEATAAGVANNASKVAAN